MVFKLVRVDCVEPSKVELKTGIRVFGRNNFLSCDDKKVSRNHGQFEVTDEFIKLTALHQNPCFIKKKGVNETMILNQGSAETINNGDQFGLLPQSYWYEVILANIDSSDCNGENGDEIVNFHMNEDDGDEMLQDIKVNDERMVNHSSSPSLLNTENGETDSESDARKRKNDGDESEVPNKVNRYTDSNDESNQSTQTNTDSIDSKPTVCNEVHSEQRNNPNIKTEVKRETHSLKQEQQSAPPSPIKPQQSNQALRERCMYGAACYRKNPQHRQDFSHPNDADWGPDQQAPCPYGVSCSKTDARHWRDHSHPPETPRPGAAAGNRRQGGRVRKKMIEGLIDESNNEPLPSKRARKQLNKKHWSDSEEEADPFHTDDEDDWMPE